MKIKALKGAHNAVTTAAGVAEAAGGCALGGTLRKYE